MQVEKSLNNTATVFQAEAKAISYCAELLCRKNTKNKVIHLFSDSESVLKAIKNNKITSKVINECVTNLKHVCENNEVKLYWIPGHEGYVGNEKADKLAKRGAMNIHGTRKIKLGISQKAVRTSARNWLVEKSSQNFRQTLGTRHSKIVIKEFVEQRSKKILKLERNELRNVIAFYTGHGRFRRHLQNIQILNESKCKFCG